MRLARRSCFLLLLLAPNLVLSQSNNVVEGGKSIVTCVFRDHTGSRWTGTLFGLIQEQGSTVIHHTHDSTNKNSLINNSVISIAEDKHNNIWAGTKSGVSRFDLQKKTFTNFSSFQIGDRQITNGATYVFSDSNRNIWISIDGGLAYYNFDSNKFIPFSLLADGSLPDFSNELSVAGTPYYNTWWVILLCIIGLIAGVYALYSYRVKRLLKLEKLRARIATDLHDEIGATLSSITTYSESVREKAKEKLPEVEPLLEKMGTTGRTMVSNISDIVWAIDPKNDDVEMMIHRMHAHAYELCALKKVNLHPSTEKLLYPTRLSLEERRNVYLIFKEALLNALNYSDCKNIGLELGKKGNQFIMEIIDDGKGFVHTKETEGVGLRTMRSRAKEIQGELLVHSGEKGTTIHLSFPVDS